MRTRTPECDVYFAPVAVCVVFVSSVIELIPALTNLCSYARSVTATPTVPLYPEPNVSCG